MDSVEIVSDEPLVFPTYSYENDGRCIKFDDDRFKDIDIDEEYSSQGFYDENGDKEVWPGDILDDGASIVACYDLGIAYPETFWNYCYVNSLDGATYPVCSTFEGCQSVKRVEYPVTRKRYDDMVTSNPKYFRNACYAGNRFSTRKWEDQVVAVSLKDDVAVFFSEEDEALTGHRMPSIKIPENRVITLPEPPEKLAKSCEGYDFLAYYSYISGEYKLPGDSELVPEGFGAFYRVEYNRPDAQIENITITHNAEDDQSTTCSVTQRTGSCINLNDNILDVPGYYHKSNGAKDVYKVAEGLSLSVEHMKLYGYDLGKQEEYIYDNHCKNITTYDVSSFDELISAIQDHYINGDKDVRIRLTNDIEMSQVGRMSYAGEDEIYLLVDLNYHTVSNPNGNRIYIDNLVCENSILVFNGTIEGEMFCNFKGSRPSLGMEYNTVTYWRCTFVNKPFYDFKTKTVLLKCTMSVKSYFNNPVSAYDCTFNEQVNVYCGRSTSKISNCSIYCGEEPAFIVESTDYGDVEFYHSEFKQKDGYDGIGIGVYSIDCKVYVNDCTADFKRDPKESVEFNVGNKSTYNKEVQYTAQGYSNVVSVGTADWSIDYVAYTSNQDKYVKKDDISINDDVLCRVCRVSEAPYNLTPIDM